MTYIIKIITILFVYETYFRSEGTELTLAGLIDPDEANGIVDPDQYNETIDIDFVEKHIGFLELKER